MAEFSDSFHHIFKDWIEPGNSATLFPLPPSQSDLRRVSCYIRYLNQLGFTYQEYIRHFRDVFCRDVWNSISGDTIQSQELADSIFRFALLTDSNQAISLIQLTLGRDQSGVITQNLIQSINSGVPTNLTDKFSIAKMLYYDYQAHNHSIYKF